VPAGTQLRVVKVTDTGFVVTDEKREFPATEGQISTGVAAWQTRRKQTRRTALGMLRGTGLKWMP
jgi:hypothetical protein